MSGPANRPWWVSDAMSPPGWADIECEHGMVADDLALGTAELIVRAVNAHDRLVAALEEIREEAEDHVTGATDATPEEKAFMRVLLACERALNR